MDTSPTSHSSDPDVVSAIPLFMSEVEALGGAERSVLALGRWLYRHGRPVYLLTYQDRVGLARHADFPLPTVELHPAGGVLGKVQAVCRHFATRDFDSPAPITSGYQPALHTALAGVGRFHCLMHDTPSLFDDPERRSWKQRVRFALSNRIIARGMRHGGGAMIVTSEFLQRECLRDFNLLAEIARMGGLGDPNVFRRRPFNGQLRMLSVCRLEVNKRIDWILDALAALEHTAPASPSGSNVPLSAHVDWGLVIAGEGSQKEALRERIHELGLESRVDLCGFVPDAALEQLYASAHLFLMPAVQGYGIPAIEALQRGMAVLLHRDSGVSDILLDTPWAAVLRGGKDEMQPRLAAMIDWLCQNGPMHAPPPENLPTEESWAERVAMLCGYL